LSYAGSQILLDYTPRKQAGSSPPPNDGKRQKEKGKDEASLFPFTLFLLPLFTVVELTLKPISREGIPEAISKAEHYRYLNEPGEAESICRDILALEPDNQTALRLLGLALTDQFTGNSFDRYAEAESIFQNLQEEYKRLYYVGILHERQAKALLTAGRSPHTVAPFFEEAMQWFEKAQQIRLPGNDEAILRWNRCARILQSRLGSEWRKPLETIDAGDSPPL
jgi:tetratricopeptide (TPR) repeat protein